LFKLFLKEVKAMNLGSIQLPINSATKTFGVIGKRGGGKTYTGGVMAEEFYKAKIPFVVFDPIDTWYGLRLSVLALAAGLSASSGTFGTYLSKLRSNHLIVEQGGYYQINPEL
jgi:DNA helicase HerA-like ATPase